ncbi:MAG: tRNA-dihydrouridine synthase family protein [Verrucomicrobia bacterium]|nr:tRNA-dihydrouridine synthase family protein [Verrucomicrobiota bacterium]
MFDACVIRHRRFVPARFCAPMAGYTHSAFRRLVAELGGCGALWTEMLAARQILNENFDTSPWLRRPPHAPPLVYQLMVRAGDPLDRILARLAAHGADALDLNLACDALSVRAQQAGSALFDNLAALRTVLASARRHWPGLLTAKLRLGSRRPDWQPRLAERLRLLEDEGADALVLHPRFFEDKFRRTARFECIAWAASRTRLPVIASGDLHGPEHVHARADSLQAACAVMIGRMAIVRPWLFAGWDRPVTVDLPEIWRTMCRYIREDFPPPVAYRRIQMFTKYFAANFAFGHPFHAAVANAPSLGEVIRRAEDFFSRSPAPVAEPVVAGL